MCLASKTSPTLDRNDLNSLSPYRYYKALGLLSVLYFIAPAIILPSTDTDHRALEDERFDLQGVERALLSSFLRVFPPCHLAFAPQFLDEN